MKRYQWLVLGSVILLPGVALAAPGTLKDLAKEIVTVINAATVTLIFAGLVIYLYGAGINIFKAGERGSKELNKYLVWGILAIFVMVSVWGILRLLQDTVFGNASYNPSTGGARAPSGFGF